MKLPHQLTVSQWYSLHSQAFMSISSERINYESLISCIPLKKNIDLRQVGSDLIQEVSNLYTWTNPFLGWINKIEPMNYKFPAIHFQLTIEKSP